MHPKSRQNPCALTRVLKWPLVICTSACAPYALAQEISTETTEPVTTSTIANGAPGDITITEDGSIELTGIEGQVAVTMDSDNNITHDGSILIEDTNNVTGIVLEADRTGDLTMSGSISLIEDYTREDTDDDDDDDGPLAIGENRVGIRLENGGTHTGDINLQTGSTIAVEGNQSAGILLGSNLDGALTIDGVISVLGEDTIGIEIADGVSGDVLISSSVSAQGANARGVSVDGSVGGNLTVESSITSTGFTDTGETNYLPPLEIEEDTDPVEERIDAEDLNNNGPALAIGGSLTNGFLINGNVDDFVSDEDTEDETKDTIEDFDENRTSGVISSIGSGPAVLISPDLNGAATENITLGPVIETIRDTTDDDEDEDLTETLAVFDYTQGLINRGTMSANGLNVGYEATALRIEGSADGNFTTTITGGMLNTGAITADAREADATAISLGSGAIIGALENTGTISANVSSLTDFSATALLVEEGAEISELINSGTLAAGTFGEAANAIAIRDLSNGLTAITNTGSITAAHSFDGTEVDNIGETRAIDLSTSTQDITVLQTLATPTDDVNSDDVIDSDDVVPPALIGDVLFGSGNDTLTSTSGTIIGDVEFGLGNATMTLSGTDYAGDIAFSDGDNALSFTSGNFVGDVLFGGNTATFNLTNAIYTGQIISDGTLESLTAVDTDLLFSEGTSATMTTFSLTGDSLLQVDLDPNATNAPATLTVTGTATLGDSVKIRPDLQGISSTDFTHTFIDAGSLVFDGTLDESLIQDTPFIYNVELVANDDVRDTLDLEFSLKTTEELGLDLNQAAAYAAVLDVFSGDDELGAALAEVSEESEFFQIYNLLLPQRTDAATRYLSSQSSAVFGALGNRIKTLSSDEEKPFGFWAQEYFTVIDIEEDTDVPGYNGSGLGFAAGLDSRIGFLDVAGLQVNYSSGDFEEKTGGSNPVTTSSFGIGLYAKESLGPLDFVIASQISNVDFNSRREIEIDEFVFDQAAEWTGTSAMTSASVASEFEMGQFYARPQISVDYFRLEQDAYTETGDERLALEIGAADTDRSSATAVLDLGARLPVGDRSPALIIPEVSIGYRGELSSSPYETTARFLSSEETFDILAQDSFSDAFLAGISLSTDSIMGSARFGYDVEIAEEGIIHFGGATLKLKF